ncbi:hypothetical protein A8B75_19310 [Sphingomonadales bacterium EhC05]|nr:hypothetical protein A8B75_19310 [Sphingomonadales bacterium EhC05]
MSGEKSIKALLYKHAQDDFYTFARLLFPEFSPSDQFAPGWHIQAICYNLQNSFEGKSDRLIVCLPPRSLKTYLVSIAFPAWVLGKQPSAQFICASYSQALAETFSRETLRIMQSARYARVFPNLKLNPKKISATEITTVNNGGRLATSVGGTLTGRGADYFIIDDPLKAEDAHSEVARNACIDWFRNTASSRLNNPKTGRFLLVAQRLHQEDLAGVLEENSDWEKLVLPMIEWEDREVAIGNQNTIKRQSGQILQPSRVGNEELQSIRNLLGTQLFEAQYNQRPLPPGGAIFKDHWLKYNDETIPLRSYDYIIQAWDTAQGTSDSHDYSAVTTWGILGTKFHLLDASRAKKEFSELERYIYKFQRAWNADLVIIEQANAGLSLWQNITRGRSDHWLQKMSPRLAKETYALQQTPKFERGQIMLPREAKWLDTYKKELLSFPHGKHDDFVDSTTLFLRAMDTGKIVELIHRARQAHCYDTGHDARPDSTKQKLPMQIK